MAMRILVGLLCGLAFSAALLAESPLPSRPKLQILNGSHQPVDVFWLKSDTERLANGSIAPGSDAIIATTLGHRFELVGKAVIKAKAQERDRHANSRDTRDIAGWSVHIRRELLTQDAAITARALELLKSQLDEIVRVVPAAAVAELQKVPLWVSPEYPKVTPRAEYHPNEKWLREHGRDPVMAKGVEFTNVRIFEAETRRMPNFALHELAHAYHDRVVAGGFANEDVRAAYEKAKASGKYDRVERQDSEGRKRLDRAYALTTPQEYLAETTEAFFSRNDFFPYTRGELKRHDPEMFEFLAKLWGDETTP